MPIKINIKPQARPGERDELLSTKHQVTTTMQVVPGFLGYAFNERLYYPNDLVEITE